MSTRAAPKARYCQDHGIIVHGTHDVELATDLARAFTCELYDYCSVEEAAQHNIEVVLPAPVRTWLRTRPARPDEQGAWSISFWYAQPKRPGERGSFRAVEFSDDGFVFGLRVVDP
jgi:hypothetical protein